MISIETNQSGSGAVVYRITFFEPGLEQKGRTFDAHSMGEVHAAINHYFIANHEDSMSSVCPLCRSDR